MSYEYEQDRKMYACMAMQGLTASGRIHQDDIATMAWNISDQMVIEGKKRLRPDRPDPHAPDREYVGPIDAHQREAGR